MPATAPLQQIGSNMSKQKVVVGMSGGVDSSVDGVAAQGTGLRRRRPVHEELGRRRRRRILLDAPGLDRRGLGGRLIGIDVEAVNFAAEYKDRVFAEFLREYSAGRTPNPDVLCNAEIKFKAFLDHAMSLGAETIATGHYARVRETRRPLRAAEGRSTRPRTSATSCIG